MNPGPDALKGVRAEEASEPGIGASRVGGEIPTESAWGVRSGRRAPCPVCGFPMSAIQGSRAAICGNCGFKDGCC
jgi:hypothetical protein